MQNYAPHKLIHHEVKIVVIDQSLTCVHGMVFVHVTVFVHGMVFVQVTIFVKATALMQGMVFVF